MTYLLSTERIRQYCACTSYYSIKNPVVPYVNKFRLTLLDCIISYAGNILVVSCQWIYNLMVEIDYTQ